MGIYTTLFVSRPDGLPAAFPGWKPPLPEPIQREVRNPFTGEVTVVESRAPDWPDDDDEEVFGEFTAQLITGDYQEYLEQRLPAALKVKPHWATKGLSTVELTRLAESLDVIGDFDCPLYPPPSQSAVLQELPNRLTQRLAELHLGELDGVAARWAKAMSQPDYTHSLTGVRITDDCTPQQARSKLWEIASLAKQAVADERLYLLTEV